MFGLDPPKVALLPSMIIFPRIYSPNENKAARSSLFDVEAARQAGISTHGSLAAMNAHVASMQGRALAQFRAREVATRKPGVFARRPRLSWTGGPLLDRKCGDPRRFVAIVRVPWFNRKTHEVEWGVHCVWLY